MSVKINRSQNGTEINESREPYSIRPPRSRFLNLSAITPPKSVAGIPATSVSNPPKKPIVTRSNL